jgi:hypothetical protein
MKLVIGSDHAGFVLNEPVIELLRSWGHTLKDVLNFPPLSAGEGVVERAEGKERAGKGTVGRCPFVMSVTSGQ